MASDKIKNTNTKAKKSETNLPGSSAPRADIGQITAGAASPISGYTVVYNAVTNSGQVTMNFSDGSAPVKYSGIPDTTIACLVALLSHPSRVLINGFVRIQE